jgi:mRNA-degrading endonuclease RelE of RelBE toxin-antitoxin system
VTVGAALDHLAVDPVEFGKPLLGRLHGLWSARVGNYRIIYSLEPAPAPKRIIVRAVRHRSIAYGRRRRG